MRLTEKENSINNMQNKLSPSGKRAFAQSFCVDYSLSCDDCRQVARMLENGPEMLGNLLSDGAFNVSSDIHAIERFISLNN